MDEEERIQCHPQPQPSLGVQTDFGKVVSPKADPLSIECLESTSK